MTLAFPVGSQSLLFNKMAKKAAKEAAAAPKKAMKAMKATSDKHCICCSPAVNIDNI